MAIAAPRATPGTVLVKLGPRSAPQDVVDALLECHARIRRFLVLALRLAESPGTEPAEARDAAERIWRYFTLAFPQHVADEDELIAPRLAGHSPEVDRALAVMRADHATHDDAVNRLVATCAAIAADPGALPARAPELAAATGSLSRMVEPHLVLEEQVIFPALRGLAAVVRDEIHAGMRARRAPAAAPA